MAAIKATDTAGNEFEKNISIGMGDQGIMYDLGWPVAYYLDERHIHYLNNNEKLCIDAGGANHKGLPVYVKCSDIRDALNSLAATISEITRSSLV